MAIKLEHLCLPPIDSRKNIISSWWWWMLGDRRETKVAAPDDLPTLEKNPAQVLERDWGLSFTLIPSVTTNTPTTITSLTSSIKNFHLVDGEAGGVTTTAKRS